MTATNHLRDYYEALCNLYTDAAAIGFPVAHCAEWYLERWYVYADWEQLETELGALVSASEARSV